MIDVRAVGGGGGGWGSWNPMPHAGAPRSVVIPRSHKRTVDTATVCFNASVAPGGLASEALIAAQ